MRYLPIILILAMLAPVCAKTSVKDWGPCENGLKNMTWISRNITYTATTRCPDLSGQHGSGWTECVNNFQNTSWVENNVFMTAVRYCENIPCGASTHKIVYRIIVLICLAAVIFVLDTAENIIDKKKPQNPQNPKEE